jgi:hypothetical protein
MVKTTNQLYFETSWSECTEARGADREVKEQQSDKNHYVARKSIDP